MLLEKVIWCPAITSEDILSGYDVSSEGGTLLADIISWAGNAKEYNVLSGMKLNRLKPDRAFS